MRRISIIAMLLAIWAMISPQNALAAVTINTNTKIEFAMSENVTLNNGKFDSILDTKIPYNSEGYVPIKSQEEIKAEKTYAKWQKKQNSAGVPKGRFTINASAYTAAADECGKSDGITASGLKVKEKRTLACPPAYPFGTKVKIDGYGTYVCEDRGGAIKGNHFDIYVETKKEAFAFGRRNLQAEVVN